VRTIDFIVTNTYENNWFLLVMMNGFNFWVGNEKDNVLDNTICGQDILFSQVHSCKIIGQYVLAGGTLLEHANPFADLTLMCISEIGVHSTVDVAQETTVSFTGETQYDPFKVVEVAPMVGECEFAHYEYECFLADSEGWLTVDLGAVSLIESIRMTYPYDDQEFIIQFSSQEGTISNFDYDWAGYGFVEMINREEEYVSIFMEANLQFVSILLTINCGEPDTSNFPS
jgi:hypothetical protein